MGKLALAFALAGCASAGQTSGATDAGDDPGGGRVDAAAPAPDACGDSDGDSVCNAVDKCPGHDDAIDADADTVADGCDVCPGADDRPDINANSVPDCSEVQSRTISLKAVGGNLWRGWHSSGGGHATDNDNTVTGVLLGNTYNSYYVFALTGFTPGVITKVTLELQVEVYTSTDATETFSVWDVTAASSAVETTGSSSTIFNDLQSGTQYATATVNNTHVNQIVSIPLAAQAATDATAKLGSDFVVGVHLDTPGAPPNWIRFGHTGSSAPPTVIRLVFQYLP